MTDAAPSLVAWRGGLLAGRRIALAGSGTFAPRLSGLGADVHELPELEEEAAEAWARERSPLHALVLDARPAFGAGGPARLRAACDLAWQAVRAVAVGALIGGGAPAKIVLVGPAAGAAEHAGAVRAALENLARTLSTEWARYAITAVAVLPGARTDETEITELVTMLVSPAGEYFSGCRFELGAVAG